MRLFRSILVLMLLASAVPALMSGYVVVSSNRDELVTGALELASERVERLRLQALTSLSEVARDVEAAAKRAGEPGAPLPERRRALAALLEHQDEIAVVTVYDAKGEKVPGLQAFAAGDVAPSEIAEHDARAAALLAQGPEVGPRRWSPVYRAPHRQEAVVTLVMRVGGEATGALAAEISLRPLQGLVERSRVGSRGFAFFIDGEGRYLAHPDPAWVLDRRAEPQIVAQAVRSLGALSEGGVARVSQLRDSKGQDLLCVYAVIPELRWGIVAQQPREDAFAGVQRMLQTTAVAGLASLLLTIALSAGFARSVSRPVRDCVRGALEIARGAFGHQVSVRTRNEIGELAYTFNYMSRELKGYDEENKRLIAALEAGYLDTIKSLAGAIDAKDPYTRGHSQRVSDLSVEIGKEMRCDERTLKLLEFGGILHDIGKIGVPEHILCKRSRLTDEEMAVMRGHPEIGGDVIDGVDFLRDVIPAIRNHHERWDGTGYPDRMKGEVIPLIARIVNVADTWDACTSTRPYQVAMSADQALEIMAKLRGTQADPDVHDALVRVVCRRGAQPPKASAEPDAVAAVEKETVRA